MPARLRSFGENRDGQLLFNGSKEGTLLYNFCSFRSQRGNSGELSTKSRRGRNSMLAGILIATSATIALFLGLVHMYLTFCTRAFAVRDAALEEMLKSASPRISGQMTMGLAWVGFHASHALGIIFFGLVYGYLALAARDFLIRSPFLVVLGALVLFGYVVLAKLYFFRRPLVGAALALACYVAGVVVAYA